MPVLPFRDYYINSIDLPYETIWINESFKTAQEVFSRDNDPTEVANVLSQFKSLAQRGKIKREDKDITKWMRKPFSELKDLVDQSKEVKSGKETRTDSKKDSISLGQFGDWMVIIPLSETASCYYGKGTKWCTAARDLNHFNNYFSRGITLVYFINKSTGEKMAMAVPDKIDYPIECYDERDNSISLNDISSDTGIDRETINDLIGRARNHEGVTNHRQQTFHKKIIDAYNEVVPEAEAYLKDTRKMYDNPNDSLSMATRLSNVRKTGYNEALGSDRAKKLSRLISAIDTAMDANRFAKMVMSYYANGYYSVYDYKQVLAKVISQRGYEEYVPKEIRDALVNNLQALIKKQKEESAD